MYVATCSAFDMIILAGNLSSSMWKSKMLPSWRTYQGKLTFPLLHYSKRTISVARTVTGTNNEILDIEDVAREHPQWILFRKESVYEEWAESERKDAMITAFFVCKKICVHCCSKSLHKQICIRLKIELWLAWRERTALISSSSAFEPIILRPK